MKTNLIAQIKNIKQKADMMPCGIVYLLNFEQRILNIIDSWNLKRDLKIKLNLK